MSFDSARYRSGNSPIMIGEIMDSDADAQQEQNGKVSVKFDFHGDEFDTKKLPLARQITSGLFPGTVGSGSDGKSRGTGISPVGTTNGAHVVCMFTDADMNNPIILGTIGADKKDENDTKLAGSDNPPAAREPEKGGGDLAFNRETNEYRTISSVYFGQFESPNFAGKKEMADNKFTMATNFQYA